MEYFVFIFQCKYFININIEKTLAQKLKLKSSQNYLKLLLKSSLPQVVFVITSLLIKELQVQCILCPQKYVSTELPVLLTKKVNV